MEKKIPVWLVLAIVFLMAIGTVLFGWVVHHAARGGILAGALGDISLSVARFPSLIKHTYIELFSHPGLAVEQRFAGQSGLAILDPDFSDDGYLLLSRVNGDLATPMVELVEIASGRVVHRWSPDIDAINDLSELRSEYVDLDRDKNARRYRIVHPLLAADGSIVFHDRSPLVKINACSSLDWTVDGAFHHAIEFGPDGDIWASLILEPSSFEENPYPFHRDDAIARISPRGEILSVQSVAGILFRNGYKGLMFGAAPYENDLLHLNDIQPALADGAFWEKGDLLISTRFRSAVFLYRPATDKVVWMSVGPWLNQHDPNFLDDGEISVFGNDVVRRIGEGQRLFGPANDVYVVNLGDDSVRTPYADALIANDVRTLTEGRARILANGDLFVEETNYGRLLRVSPSGTVRWQFINRAADGDTYILAWSRYLDRGQAAAALAALSAVDCGG